MRLVIDRQIIESNLNKARSLVSDKTTIAVMLKSFYEFVDIPSGDPFLSRNKEGGICYTVGKATEANSGAVVLTRKHIEDYRKLRLKRFYVPVNTYDNREGLSLKDAMAIVDSGSEYTLMVTGGCMDSTHADIEQIIRIWEKSDGKFDRLSIGGSFYLQHRLPNFVNEVRIGEYELFGTIPYSANYELFGKMALMVEMTVLHKYEDGRLITDGGKEYIDAKNSMLLSGGLQLLNQSSDYGIYRDLQGRYKEGDTIEILPDYWSLLKLQYVERSYKE